MDNKTFTAIDIGTTKIVVVRGKSVGEHKIEISDMGRSCSYGIERGIVKNIDDTAASIKDAINKLHFNEDLGSDVWVGIAGQHVRSTLSGVRVEFESEEHLITLDDIEKVCRKSFQASLKPGEKIVNATPQSFEVKEGRFKEMPIGKQSDFISINMHLTIAQESAFNSINKTLKINGLRSKEIVLESIASAKSVLSKDEIMQGVALLDIGGGTSDLAVFKDGAVVHSAVIPFGGESVTLDIQKAFGVNHQYAEKLKHDYGYILKTGSTERINLKNEEGKKIKIKQKDLSFVIKSRMDEIIELVKFQLELSGYVKHLDKGIVLTGGGSLLKDLMQHFAFHFKQIPLRLGRPNQQFFSIRTDDDMNNPIYATATGLLLFGIDMHYKNELNKKQDASISQSKEKDLQDEHKEKTSFLDSMRGRFKNFFYEEDHEF